MGHLDPQDLFVLRFYLILTGAQAFLQLLDDLVLRLDLLVTVAYTLATLLLDRNAEWRLGFNQLLHRAIRRLALCGLRASQQHNLLFIFVPILLDFELEPLNLLPFQTDIGLLIFQLLNLLKQCQIFLFLNLRNLFFHQYLLLQSLNFSGHFLYLKQQLTLRYLFLSLLL